MLSLFSALQSKSGVWRPEGNSFFCSLDRVIRLCTFGKQWVFVLNPDAHPVNTRYTCGMDAAWFSILCFTADLTCLLGPRSTCIHFILKNWWWHYGEAGSTDQHFLFTLPSAKSYRRLVLASEKSCLGNVLLCNGNYWVFPNLFTIYGTSFAVFLLFRHLFMYFERRKFSEGV